MLGMLSSQLAFSAATTLAKKTFEFSITSSLKDLSDVIRERFSHSQVLQDTQAELEAKVKMLCLPVDLLAHFATQGNTALQEPLGVALGVLEEVESFRQALVQHDVTRAQDGSSPEAATASAAQLCKRLRELICRLDSLLPYLNLAISTAVLLSQGSPSPVSYSRLMAASWHLRASPQPGAAVFSLAEASWHEERRLTSAGPAMGEAFRRCRLTVCRCGAAAAAREGAPASPFQGSAGESAGSFGYELLVEQDLDDGLYHEPSEQAAALRVQVADIVGLDWETTQSLGQGENEYRPALVLHMWQSSSAAAAGADTPASAAAAGEQVEGGGLHTPPESLPRPTSRAGSRRGGTAAAEPSAAAGAGSVTPQQALQGGSPGGVGGTLRRCAITLIPRPVIDTASGSEDGGEDAGDVAHDAAADDSDDSAGGGDRPLGLLAGPGGLHTGGAAALQREWQLLGELEFVLRLCILEWREQAPHQSVTDERIALHFQATSAPASSHAHRGAAARTTAPSRTAGAYDSALLRRSGTAAQRWRNAAAGTAHAISEGIEALTHGVRQLSFTPGGSKPGSGPAAPVPASEEAAVEPASGEAGSAGSRRQTRRSSRMGGRGFGSPVQ